MFTISKFYKAVGLAALAAAAVCSVATPATAQGYVNKQGTITSILISSSENYAFRVTLSNAGADPLSDCNYSFAYINGSYSNYNVYVATILSAYHSNHPVTLVIFKDANKFCQISEVMS